MYGLIGKIKVTPGQRDTLISILIEGIAGMPGCLSYVVAQDHTDQDAIWVTEVWISQTSRQNRFPFHLFKRRLRLENP